jgi:hypothetical protein
MEVEEPKMNFIKQCILKLSRNATNNVVDDSKKKIAKLLFAAMAEAEKAGFIAKQEPGCSTGIGLYVFTSSKPNWKCIRIGSALVNKSFLEKTLNAEDYQKFVNEVLK